MEPIVISKFVVEIRYKPTGKVLDKRGEIADTLTSDLLNLWDISANRIDFRSEDEKDVTAFFSYRNFGFASKSPQDKDFFQNNAIDFIKRAWPLVPQRVSRVGVRSSFFVSAPDFTKVFQAYKDKFFGLEDYDLEKFGGNLVDVGFPLNFTSGKEKYNVMTGPMEKEQAVQFFGDGDLLPACGAYTDVDYFINDSSELTRQKDVLSALEMGLTRADNLKTLITEWVIR